MGKPQIEACMCDSGVGYAECCGALHRGQPASTAEQLMRSRYSAFVLGDLNYLRASWHPSTLPKDLSLDANRQQRWLGLSVIAHTQSSDDHATVEFIARRRVGDQPAQRHHELSRFVRVDRRWLYLDGDVKP